MNAPARAAPRAAVPRWTAAGALGTACLLLATASAPAGGQDITVGENVRVSGERPDQPHYELHLAAHPTDPDVLLGAGMAWRAEENKYDVVAYRSADGGASWEESLAVDRTSSSMDPALAFGPGDRAYLVEFGSDADDGSEMLLHRSADGGTSWLEPTEITGMDRPFVSVGPAGTDHAGRVFVHGTEGTQPLDGDGTYASGVGVLRSTDHGATLAPRVNLHSTGENYVLGMGNSVVLPDGSLAILFGERRSREEISPYEASTPPAGQPGREPNTDLKLLVSDDGGESFAKARTVSGWHSRFGRGPTGMVPSLAVDRTEGPFRGRLYAAWTDYRSGEGQVLLAHSDDRGKSWSDPVVVNRDGGPAFRPVLDVNDAGVLGITWYDRRDSPTGLGYAVRFTASRDGGVSLTESVRVSEEPFRFAWDGGLVLMGSGAGGGHPSEYRSGGLLRGTVSLHHFNNKGGDTAGMAAGADGAFHPFWVDNRTGVPQIWTARVEVAGEAVRHGDPALAELEDVTGKTRLRIDRNGYDPAAGSVSLRVRLENTSSDTLEAPMALRVRSLWSEFGEVELTNTDDGGTGLGAVYRLDDHLEDGRLPPDSASAPMAMEAVLEEPAELGPMDPPPPGRRVRGGYSLLTFDLQALARSGEGASEDGG